jgi:tetrahydromethanopterin S-methyltransferase subunit G
VTDREQENAEREAREALDRVRRDSETVGSSSMARLGRRLGDHLGGRDAVGEDGKADPIELWGRRIGRSLSIVAFVVLSLWLAYQLRLF